MAQVNTVGQPKRLPLVSNIESRDGLRELAAGVIKDAQLVNCYAEYDQKLQEFVIQKRPGFSSAIFTPSVLGRGLGIFPLEPDPDSFLGKDAVIALIGGSSPKAYVIYDIDPFNLTATSIDLGTINSTGSIYRFIQLPKSAFPANLIAFNNGVKAYYIRSDLGAVTEILPADDFPNPHFPGWAYLNSRLYVPSPNNKLFGGLNLNDPAIWDPLNLILAQDESDIGIGLAKHLTFATYFKRWTTEFFFNDPQNLTGSTLSAALQNKLDIGAFSADSFQEIDGSIFFVSSNKSRMIRVARLDDLKYTIVSTPLIEKILEQYDFTIKTFVFKICGHRFFIINATGLSVGAITLVYDIDQQLWYRWERPDAESNLRSWTICSTANTGVGGIGRSFSIVQNSQTGTLHIAAPDYVTPTDNGTPCTVDIYTSNYDAGIDRKKQVNMMYFNADNVSGSILKMRTNDYDFASDKWTGFRDIQLGVEKPQLANCGSFYRRAHHFRHEAPLPFRIRSVGLQMDIGDL